MKAEILYKKLPAAVFTVITAVVLLSVFWGTSPAGALRESIDQDYTLYAENAYLQLYLHEENTDLVVYHKEAEKFWFSNPVYRPEVDMGARDEVKAQISIDYFTLADRRRDMNNFSDSIEAGQFAISEIEKGVRIDYVLGREWRDRDYLPVVVAREKFENLILDSIEDEGDRQFFRENYFLMTLEPRAEDEEKQDFDIHNLDEDSVFGDYRVNVKEGDPAEAVEALVDQLVAHREGYEDRTYISAADVDFMRDSWVYVRRTGLRAWDEEDLIDLIQGLGYTPYEVQDDHFTHGLQPPQPGVETFNIPVEYFLDGEDFVARIPAGEVEFPMNILDREGEEVSFPLYNIALLEHFGAADTQKEGYMVVPSGSGGLINLNSDKSGVYSYSMPLYGRDHSLLNREQLSERIQNYFPVFGIKHEDKAVMGIIESGDALGRINAELPSAVIPANRVYANFNILPYTQLVLGSQDHDARINRYQARQYMDDIQIRYSFFGQNEADYVSMAHQYQDYLVDNYGLEKRDKPRAEIPFFVELVGGITEITPRMGIPRESVKAMTTFSQAQSIISALKEREINNINLIYSGWLTDGMAHDYPHQPELEEALGTEEEFAALRDYLQKEDIDFYPALNVMNVNNNSWFNNFRTSRMTARFLDGDLARKYSYNIVSSLIQPGSGRYILSPHYYESLFDSFIPDFQENISPESIALREMGRQLNSDFREEVGRLIDRQQAQNRIVGQLADLSGNNQLDISVFGGNAYVLPYVEQILELPLRANYFRIIDQSIPFYQIALKGYKDFTGPPINLVDNPRQSMLRTVETGAAPYYRWFYADGAGVMRTDFEELYSAHYGDWLDSAGSFYEQANNTLRKLYDQRITGHQKIKENVYQTEYEDGSRVVINYGQKTAEIEGYEIPARDFILIEEGVSDGS